MNSERLTILVICCFCLAITPPADADERDLVFESDIQHDVLPIMLLRCTACHGARSKQGGLDLRTPAAMRTGGQSGPAFVPGDPDASLMIQRDDLEAGPSRETCGFTVTLVELFVPPQSHRGQRLGQRESLAEFRCPAEVVDGRCRFRWKSSGT